MESTQGSWQYEFSSAKDAISPLSPVHPPSSPTLYSLINDTPVVSPNNKLGGDVLEYNQSTFLVEGIKSTSPFINDDGATSLLSSVSNSSLGGIGNSTAPARSYTSYAYNNHFSTPNEMDDADLAWNDEESFNLEAFEGFEDLDVAEVNNLLDSQDEIQLDSTTITNNNLLLATPVEPNFNESSVALNEPQEKIGAENKNELLDQFDSILKNLEASSETNRIDGEIIDIFNTAELAQLENEGIDLGVLSVSDGDILMEEDDDDSNDGGSSSAGSYQSDIMDTQEIYVCFDETSSSISSQRNNNNIIVAFNSPSSVASNSSIDDEDDRQEMTLDALLGGDLESAVALYPTRSRVSVSRSRGNIKTTLNAIQPSTAGSRSAIVKAGLALQKPERRGRKPSSVAVGKPWVHVKDKALRKKEQNKTAATRYRQKKKMEAEVSMQQEQELAVEYDILMKQKENLAKEISIVKGLLREFFSVKKAQKKRR